MLRAGGAEGGHVVIVGGGITGLSAAFYLQRPREGDVPASYTLVEREPRLGGKIHTERIDSPGPFLIEAGPDSFLASRPWAVELANELGLGRELIRTNSAPHPVYVLASGKPEPLPEGVSLGIPTRLLPLALSPVLSLPGKLRMAADLVIPPGSNQGDESLADFIRRRVGKEALERLVEPLAASIYSADPEQQSLLATFPQLRTLEQQHGGLIRGMMAARGARSADQDRGASAFLSFREGLGSLVRAVSTRLNGRLLAGVPVSAIERLVDGEHSYRVTLDDGTSIAADAVVLATPAFVAADLVASFAPELAVRLKAIRYASTAAINLAYSGSEVRVPLEGYGLVVPRGERRSINACTVSSAKFGGRAPDDCLLVRAFVGGSRQPNLLQLEDDSLVRLVREELQVVLGIEAAPLFARVHRWPNASPQYDVGHLERVEALEALAPPGLFLAGSAYRGVGIPDCIRQGQEAAGSVRRLMRQRAAPRPTLVAIPASGDNEATDPSRTLS